MASVNQTRAHSVNQMGKTYSKLLAARHGRGMAWARHGHGMLCVNRPLLTELPRSMGMRGIIIHLSTPISARRRSLMYARSLQV